MKSDFNSTNNLEFIDVVKNSGSTNDKDLLFKNVLYKYSRFDKMSISVEEA